jgi:hypothetical protein
MYSFQRQCQPHLTETVKESVEGICLKIYHLSADYAKKIKEKHSEVLKENGISGTLIYCAFCITCQILFVACLCYGILTDMLWSSLILPYCENYIYMSMPLKI